LGCLMYNRNHGGTTEPVIILPYEIFGKEREEYHSLEGPEEGCTSYDTLMTNINSCIVVSSQDIER